MFKPLRLARAGVLLCAALAACDRGDPLAPADGAGEPLSLVRLSCTVTVATGALACAPASPSTGEAAGIVIGGPNGTYVQLTSDSHEYTPADSLYTLGVAVQNLLFQALGTTDGSTADPSGVRIFFGEEPHGTAGALVPVELVNEQRGMITDADQAYFQYGAPLHPNAFSETVSWQFRMPPEVERFAFVVYVSAATQYPDGIVQVTPPADTILAGETVQLSGRPINAYGDPVAGSITWESGDPAIATVDGSGLVTGVAPGTVTITGTSGVRSGSATISVCPSLAVGGVYTAEMPAGASFCLGQGEYVVVPVNTSASASTSLSVTGAGIIPVSGAPTPALRPGGPSLNVGRGLVPDHAWESRLRQRERTELAARPSSGVLTQPRRAGPSFAISPGVPSVGALMSLNVETDNPCSTSDIRTGRVVAVGTRIIVIADTTNPAGGLTAGDYAAIADSFDAVIHPVVTGAFGVPSDRDSNAGRVIAFYTRAVNELTPPASASYVGGFFFSRDLRSAAECPTSNVGEMFYMLAADPSGVVNGNVRDVDFVRRQTLGTLAHEYEHLVNASRRMLVNAPWNGQLEEVWLDEGLAHVAEELVFYDRAGLGARADLDAGGVFDGAQVQAAFFTYQEANFGRLRQWLLAPHNSGPFQGDDGLATRGSAWAFLRYAADRRGATESAFWSGLVNTGHRGVANLHAVLGTDPLPWFRDFAAAMYADNAFGVAPLGQYTQPSWNFRSVFGSLDYDPGLGCTCAYELAVRNPANGVSDHFALLNGGSSAFVRMGVSTNAFAGVTVRSGGATPPATIRVAVIRRK